MSAAQPPTNIVQPGQNLSRPIYAPHMGYPYAQPGEGSSPYATVNSAQPIPMNLPGMTPQQAAYIANLKHAQQIVHKKSGLLGGYSFDARDIKFAAQNPRERVFVFLRAHPITNVGWLFRSAVSLVIPLFLFGFFSAFPLDVSGIPLLNDFVLTDTFPRAVLISTIGYYSLMFTGIMRNFLNWYYNIYMVTNERVIDYNFTHLHLL